MRTFGLIGASLAHSFSKGYFTEKFKAEGIHAQYLNFETKDLPAQLEALRKNSDIAGLNITIPYKTAILSLLDAIDPEAALVGAVNTIRVESGTFKGYNTDIAGFRESLKPFLAHGMERALVLGTGGAAKAVAYVLNRLGVSVKFVSRHPKNESELSYADINAYVMRSFLLIVNTTPVGTWPHTSEKPQIPYHLLTAQHFLYDLVYNPAVTAFMHAGSAYGAGATGGLTMLKLQAEESWKIWNA